MSEVQKKRDPQTGVFELTLRCNLHCKMCLFRHADCENERLRNDELSTEQWVELARQAAEMGTLHLLFTGGEVMLRDDFCELYEKIYSFGFLIELYTNATMVTPKIMELLHRCPPHEIGVTLYGASEETYKKVCGDGKAFVRAKEGMKQLATLPSKMKFRTTLIKDNVNDLEAMEEWIRKEFGEEYMLIHSQNVYCGIRGACSDVKQVRLTPEENVELFIKRELGRLQQELGETPLERKQVRYMSSLDMDEDIIIEKQDPEDTLFGCGAGMRTYTISWDGNLLGCQMLEYYKTNPLEEGLLEAWNRYAELVTPVEEPEKCRTCNYKMYCSTCLAVRYAETGELSGIPSYICEEAQQLEKRLQYMREE